MNRPTSMAFLVVFVLWVALQNMRTLTSSNGIKVQFIEQGFIVPFYSLTILAIAGGLALAYGLYRKKSWSYPLGNAWLVMTIIDALFSTWFIMQNKTFYVQQLIEQATQEDSINTEMPYRILEKIFTISTGGFAAALTLAAVFFLWKINQHKNFFNK